MDISSELSAVASRIEQITGAPVQLPGLPEQAPQAGSFAALLQAHLAEQGGAQQGDDAAPNAPAMVAPAQIDALVNDNAQSQDVDPALIKAIIANESGFNANATSNVGAQGLMQLMPGTAAGLGVTDAYDPAQNVAGGTKYIKGLLEQVQRRRATCRRSLQCRSGRRGEVWRCTAVCRNAELRAERPGKLREVSGQRYAVARSFAPA